MFTWIVLISSGFFEAVWATALSRVEGLSNPLPIIVFIVAMCLSMLGLSFALREMPVSTAYAVWVGIGAAATTIYSIATGAEQASIAKLCLIAVLVSAVVGLKVLSDH